MLWWRSLMIFVYILESSESIRWPAGTYGIPKPASGCPWADGFKWEEGWRSQDTDDTYSSNDKSSEFHLDAIIDKKKVQRSFCIKTFTADDNNRPIWPPGKYCIYKSGQCPAGLESGYVYWDDDDNWNSNKKGGTLPSGVYDSDTKIEFCCKRDGDKNDPILLPSKSPFFLLAYESVECQMVKWAVTSVEWIYYDTEDWSNDDDRGGAYPHDAGKKHPTIYYCYYRGCNETLTALNGTFQSPNYPRKYPDGQYCSWRITVNTTQQIHLMFTDFSLQNENNTDELYAYDGENATGEVLGVFYGGHPPPKEGIYSSSNHMLVIFKSDKTGSYTGFNASYYATPSITTRTSLPPVTSKTFHTQEESTSSKEPTPTTDGSSNEGGKKDKRGQQHRKGINITAVVVPVVLVVFLAALLVAVFCYCKRMRKKKDAKPNEVTFSARSSDESPLSLENPYYERDVVIAKTNELCYSEGNDLYTEVNETDKKNGEEPYMGQENENPLYEATAADDAMLNPIYDSST